MKPTPPSPITPSEIKDEVFAPPLKVSVGTRMFEQVSSGTEPTSKRQQRSQLVKIGLLKSFESRGGGV